MLLSALALVALGEIGWTVYLGFNLPRHYTAQHWDLAWVGLDTAQVLMLLAAAWAAVTRRAVLMLFAFGAGVLLLVDAWFDVTTARYRDLDQSLWFLGLEVPFALVLFWVAGRVYRRLTQGGGGDRTQLEAGWSEDQGGADGSAEHRHDHE